MRDTLPEWVNIDEALDVAQPELDASFRAGLKATRKATRAGLDETRYIDECIRAGIEIRWSDPSLYVDARAYIPGWAVLVIEATVPKTHACTKALVHARDNVEWRDAAISVWRLGGIEALTPWVVRTLRGVKVTT